MGEKFTAEQRSACMRAVHSFDTSPEIRVRRMIHSMGYRYALHVKRLPGKPDIALISRRKVIFVHGCFWHKHTCQHGRKSPITNADYWNQKRERNSKRDRESIKTLRRDGWKVLVIWECWTKDASSLLRRLESFLTEGRPNDNNAC